MTPLPFPGSSLALAQAPKTDPATITAGDSTAR